MGKMTFVFVGKWVPLSRLPCARCEWRYSLHCPTCGWNDGRYDTYGGVEMTAEEAERKNKELEK